MFTLIAYMLLLVKFLPVKVHAKILDAFGLWKSSIQIAEQVATCVVNVTWIGLFLLTLIRQSFKMFCMRFKLFWRYLDTALRSLCIASSIVSSANIATETFMSVNMSCTTNIGPRIFLWFDFAELCYNITLFDEKILFAKIIFKYSMKFF